MTPILPIAHSWFNSRLVEPNITLLWEPHVNPMLRCNIWHVRGRSTDLLIDTGLGIASLRAAAEHLFERPLVVVLTHTHYDHLGGAYEFDGVWVHGAEAPTVTEPERDADWVTLLGSTFPAVEREHLASIGYPLEDVLIDHLPEPDYDPASYQVRAARCTRVLNEGDVVDLGDRAFEIFHLPGHSPGSIGLWEARTGLLFSGDAIYDGPLLDELPGSNLADYVATIERLRTLPVQMVHGGHDPSFGRERLVELCDDYLTRRRTR